MNCKIAKYFKQIEIIQLLENKFPLLQSLMKTQIGKDNQVELKHEFCKCFYSFSLLDPIPWCLL